MSTVADELTSLCDYISAYTDVTYNNIAPKLHRLEELASNRGFVHPDTIEATRLRVAAADLRKLAERIDLRRNLLEANAKERV